MRQWVLEKLVGTTVTPMSLVLMKLRDGGVNLSASQPTTTI
jgi:hypothetical protein